jgi:hypothetical protein
MINISTAETTGHATPTFSFSDSLDALLNLQNLLLHLLFLLVHGTGDWTKRLFLLPEEAGSGVGDPLQNNVLPHKLLLP